MRRILAASIVFLMVFGTLFFQNMHSVFLAINPVFCLFVIGGLFGLPAVSLGWKPFLAVLRGEGCAKDLRIIGIVFGVVTILRILFVALQLLFFYPDSWRTVSANGVVFVMTSLAIYVILFIIQKREYHRENS